VTSVFGFAMSWVPARLECVVLLTWCCALQMGLVRLRGIMLLGSQMSRESELAEGCNCAKERFVVC
jgi:hypothetical protein